MSREKMSVMLATAIASANAVIKHMKLGLFLSEYNGIDEQTLRFSKFAGNARYALSGRTNSGQWALVHTTILFKKERGESFPIEKVYVAISPSATERSKYFECSFSGDDFIIKEIDGLLLKEDSKRPVWQTDESPDAWATRYHP